MRRETSDVRQKSLWALHPIKKACVLHRLFDWHKNLPPLGMNLRFIPLLALCLACHQQAKEEPLPVDSVPTNDTGVYDTTSFKPDTPLTQPSTVPPPPGAYRALLPGSLEHTLAFYPGRRYRLEERKGFKASATKTEGEWSASGTNLLLYKEGAVVGKYRWQGDTLVYLLGGKEYRLERLMSAMDNDVWRAKKKEGIEFFGVGNEPFWNVEVDEQKSIAFHLSEWTKPLAFPPAKPLSRGDSIVYTTANDSATLRVVIYHTFCSDGMSDYHYDQKVKVVYNGRLYSGCGLLYK